MSCWGLACGTSPDRVTLATPQLELNSVPGYPASTSRLVIDLGGGLQKWCHASLVHPSWALTAAHCLSNVDPAASGAFPEWQRSFSASDVEFYPGAHQGSETHLSDVWRRQDFIASDDLALVPIEPPLTGLATPETLHPSQQCAPGPLFGLIGQVGLRDEQDDAITAEAVLLGEVDAAELLGSGQPGRLLSARGPLVGPGASGSGMTVDGDLLQPLAVGCDVNSLSDADPASQVLVGVVQDANPLDPSLPFGLVALYETAHAAWLAELLDGMPLGGPANGSPLTP
jgi:hypothetical protein